MKQKLTPISRGVTHLGLLVVAVLAGGLALSCGDSDDDGPGGDGDSTGDGDGGVSGGTSGTGSSNGGDGDASGGGDGDGDGSGGRNGTGSSGNDDPDNTACGLADAPDDNESLQMLIEELEESSCKAEAYEAESVPADIFIMFDQSTSMGDHHIIEDDLTTPTRWEALTEALKAFITSDGAEGLRIGIQYFSLAESGGASEQGFSCEVDDYATPDVAIAELPENADSLTGSLDDHAPFGLTPSGPALEGALKYAREWAIEHPERPTVVIFATDGYPTICEPEDPEELSGISRLEDIADRYAHPEDPDDPMTPPITTYVVGVGEVSNLERVAEAGGSGKAFFVADCPTAVDDLTASLERVANSPALCNFPLPDLPEGEFLDPDEVTLVFTPAGAGPEFVYRVDSSESCAGGGWYYDDNDEPQKMLVCPETCRRFGGGEVQLFLGCDSPSIK